MKQEANNPNTPFVSVIIPAHNEEQYIGRTLQSLMDQSYPKDLMEVIVVDNNSTDRTTEIAGIYDIKLLHKPDGLVGAVRNEGFRNSCGEIIAFLDADCTVPADWVKEGVSLITSNPGHTFGGFCITQEEPSFIEKHWLLPSEAPQKDLLGASIFIDRKHFIGAGQFDENISSGEDSKLSHILKKNGVQVKLSESISVVHLGNPSNLLSFFKRQAWHSENYLTDIKESLQDPVFFLILLWTISLASTITYALHQNQTLLAISATLITIVPATLTLKRLLRSKKPKIHLTSIHKLYLLDILYTAGRSYGLIRNLLNLSKSIYSTISNNNNKKNKPHF